MSILSVRGLSKTIRGRQILSGVDFALERGEAAGLVGINGARASPRCRRPDRRAGEIAAPFAPSAALESI